MNINEAFPSKYLKADVDVLPDEPLHLTIKSVTVENVGSGDKQENKPIVSFTENSKGLVLNKTNATTITKLYGPDTDAWAGKRITLLWKEVEYQGEMRPGIRVSLRAPAAPAPVNGSALWNRWYTLRQEASEMRLPNIPDLDDAASDEEIVKAGKALAGRIQAKRAEAPAEVAF
jgi:hypothetical protein